jgi:hypothetical protein
MRRASPSLADLAQLGETAITPFVEQFWRSV